MSTQQNYIDAVDQFVQGDVPITADADKLLAIKQALKLHSKFKPVKVVEDFNGDGGFDYAIDDFASWSTGFSVIKSIEYPVDDDDQSPDMLQDDAWMIYTKPAGDYLRFLEDKPSASEDFRVTYTAQHAISVTACSVDDFDEVAVQALAASFFCNMISTYYAQGGEPMIDADSVDHKSRSSEYKSKANMYKAVYYEHMGIKEGKVKAASVTRDQDAAPSWQSDKLTHNRKFR